jgi:drug/metabolite transporter (DMT)-like permease
MVFSLFFLHLTDIRSLDVSGIQYFALAGIIHFVGGWGFMNSSASRIGATRVSALASLTPLFAALIAFVTLNQTLNIYIVGGIVLVAVGLFFIATNKE